eukprot:1159537-Pelagomonas_calceolata.AAC.3
MAYEVHKEAGTRSCTTYLLQGVQDVASAPCSVLPLIGPPTPPTKGEGRPSRLELSAAEAAGAPGPLQAMAVTSMWGAWKAGVAGPGRGAEGGGARGRADPTYRLRG